MKTKLLTVILLGCATMAFADSDISTMNSSMSANMTSLDAWSVSTQQTSTAAGSTSQSSQSTKMVMTNGSTGNAAANMSISNTSSGAPVVVVNLGSPGVLTVYDQNGKVALTENLPAGKNTIDIKNFPLGTDKLVVETKQNGSSFIMGQSVTVSE